MLGTAEPAFVVGSKPNYFKLSEGLTMKKLVLVAAILSTAATVACRRETPHEPMKLGADVPAATQVAR